MPSDNIRAALFMLASMAGFVVNDTLVKLSTADIPAAEIMALRGMAASLLLLVIAWRFNALRPPRLALKPQMMLRTGTDVMATLTYITALGHMPIANASAVFQALPLVITLAAALVFKEPVGWRRWSALGVGFVGVLIIVRPGTDGFNAYSLAVLGSVGFSAVRDLTTRRMDRAVPSLFISLTTAISVSVVGWVLLPFSGGWQPVPAPVLGYLGGAALAIAGGYICIVQAMRVGDPGFVAPFRYSILLYALVMGLVVFGDLPSAATLFGSAIVVASGAYTLYRERIRGVPKVAKAQVH
ncbi:DMT family transporter [Jiella sp. M17.18]|uniref:DMT family transporter n=1 Tax=Jiella sp. M17.18 TaxID=3234247 RepID=UPI0034E0424F